MTGPASAGGDGGRQVAAGVKDGTRPQKAGGEVFPPVLHPAGVSGAGDPVPQPPAALQPVPPEVHAGGRAGARGGECPEVSFALCVLWCSACPAAAAQRNAIAPALLLPSALAWSVCRSIRGQKGLCSYLMGRQPCGDVQVQVLAVDLHLGHLLALLVLCLASHTDYLSCDCSSC